MKFRSTAAVLIVTVVGGGIAGWWLARTGIPEEASLTVARDLASPVPDDPAPRPRKLEERPPKLLRDAAAAEMTRQAFSRQESDINSENPGESKVSLALDSPRGDFIKFRQEPSQSSTLNPPTRRNSRSLLLSSVTYKASAWPESWSSYGLNFLPIFISSQRLAAVFGGGYR